MKNHTKKFWTEEEYKILKEKYPYRLTSELAKEMNRTEKSLYSQATLMGLKKDQAFLDSVDSGRILKLTEKGKETRFNKGNVPWNKGLKGCIPPNVTSFKKGQRPHNALEVGDILITEDGYQRIKIAEPNQWKYIHRMVWEETHGPIPKDSIVIFKDGNKLNCNLENLELLTKRENMIRNAIHQYPAEIKSTIKAISKLKKAIKNHATK
jgi:hypothetical protein